MFLAAASVAACAGIPRPKGEVGIVHSKAGTEPYINNFDFEKDFDDIGDVIAGHKGTHKAIEIQSLDKFVCSSAASYASANAFKKKLMQRLKDCEAGK